MNQKKIVPDNDLRLKYGFYFIKQGAKKMLHNKITIVFAVIYVLIIACVVKNLYFGNDPFGMILDLLYSFAISMASVFIPILILYWLGMPAGFISIMQNLSRTGLSNSAGETPVLISRTKKANNKQIEVWEFETFGIAFSKWADYFEQIESALDIAITNAEQGNDGRKVLLTVVPHPGPWPIMLPWNVSYLSEKMTVLVLGENRGEKVFIDLAKTPHFSISATTGGGKSILQQNLMLQCALQNIQILLVDYKSGIDYSAWRDHIKILTDDEAVIDCLNRLLAERERRFNLFYTACCANIDEYNRKIPDDNLPRICLFVDEITDCLDKTNASKERKERIPAISGALSSLARLSRAAGIHMVLAQQRGSADILPGSVRNNVYKICGRCDENLSLLTLGTTDAAKKIPSTTQGRFLDENGIMFQGYYSDFSPEMLSGISFNNDFEIE